MHSLVILASCLVSFAALSTADEEAERPLESVQLVEKLKKNAGEALDRLKSTLEQALDQVEDIVDKSIFRHHADIIHRNSLDAVNGNYSQVQEAIAVLRSQNETSEPSQNCLKDQHNRVAKAIQTSVDRANDIVTAAIDGMKSQVLENLNKYDRTKLIERIEKIIANIDDIDSYLDAIKIIIDNLDLPIQIVKSTVEYVAEKEMARTTELERDILKTDRSINRVADQFLTNVQHCLTGLYYRARKS